MMFSTFAPIASPFAIYLLITVAYTFLPGRVVQGYCCDNETLQPLTYKLTGFSTFILVTVVYYTFSKELQIYIYRNYWFVLIGANTIGLTVSLLFFITKGDESYSRCVTVDQVANVAKLTKSSDLPKPTSWEVFYLGRRWNPRIFQGRCDIKMLFYCIGAIMLWINILSAASFHIFESSGHISNGLIAYFSCFSWFIVEYLLGEEVHLYTYDLFAEKMGFKLSWGCLVFYPFFYSIGVHPIAQTKNVSENDISQATVILVCSLYFIGWVITRGANMQKYYFKIQPRQKTVFFGLITQQTISDSRILCSGFWGCARHFNYFGEIIQGIALAIPGSLMALHAVGNSSGAQPWWWHASYALLPWAYPVYYTALFVSRQIDDEVVCARKYGKVWDEYVKQVPYRIFPGVY